MFSSLLDKEMKKNRVEEIGEKLFVRYAVSVVRSNRMYRRTKNEYERSVRTHKTQLASCVCVCTIQRVCHFVFSLHLQRFGLIIDSFATVLSVCANMKTGWGQNLERNVHSHNDRTFGREIKMRQWTRTVYRGSLSPHLRWFDVYMGCIVYTEKTATKSISMSRMLKKEGPSKWCWIDRLSEHDWKPSVHPKQCD